jgi:hypothetical protein
MKNTYKKTEKEAQIEAPTDGIPYEGSEVEYRKCKFFNMLDQGLPLEFKFGRVVRNKETGKLKTIHERYKFEDQEIVNVPVHIMKHINSLMIPNSEYKKEKMTGQVQHSGTTFRNRCSLVEV